MASVYEAEQEQPRRTVALKVMSRALANTSAVRRFRYETEALARLHHPGIAQIYEAGTCDDGHGHPLPFFAMELVPGSCTLTEFAERSALTLSDRLSLFAAVCDAVHHGHQCGVIHRDLKPSNILVDGSGRTKIIDFGVARSTEQDLAGLTRRAEVGQLIGTLNYMSPEQCAGRAGVDARTDVYSLGVVLYELLSGRLPHELSRVSIPEAVRIISEREPDRLGATVPAARGDLEAIAMMAMQKEPVRRYNGAGALAADIRRYLNHQTIDARPPTVAHQVTLLAKRHRVLVGAGGALLATLVAASGFILAFAYRATRESERRLIAEQAAVRDRDKAVWQAYVASIAGAFSSMQSGEYAQARTRLDSAPPALRNWEWSLVSALIERSERTIDAHESMIYGFAMSADRRRIATVSRGGEMTVWDAADGARVATVRDPEGMPVHAVAFHADGRHVVAGADDGTVRVWDTRTDGVARLGMHGAAVKSVACAPSGLIATASTDGEAHLWRLDSGTPLRGFDDQPGGVSGVFFSRDGTRLLTWGSRGAIWIRDAEGAGVRPPLDFGGPLSRVVMSEDNSLVAAGGAEGVVRVWRVDDGSEPVTLTAAPSISTVWSLAFSPDSKRLAAGLIDRSVRIWEIGHGDACDVRLGHEEAVSGLAFDARGERLYSASWDRTIRIWPMGEASLPGPHRVLREHRGNVLGVAYSPDGALLASGGRDNMVRVWDAQLGEQLAVLDGNGGDVFSVAFSPDGTVIATGAQNGVVGLWSARTGRPVGSLGGEGPAIWSVAFSPDGSRIAAAGDRGDVNVWDAATGRSVLEFPAHQMRITTIRFSPDGSTIATSSRDSTVRLWDAASGALLRTLSGHALDVFSIVFSKDGSRLYSGSRDQTVRVWDAGTGELVEILPTQGQFITSLSISPDGTRLAAGSWFAEVVIWDLGTLDLVASFKGHDSAIRSIAFSPDGLSLASGGHDGTLSIFGVQQRAERMKSLTRARRAREVARAALERLAPAHADAEDLLVALEREFPADAEARRWARNLVLQRAGAPRGERERSE
jgi:WD40 repeat protein